MRVSVDGYSGINLRKKMLVFSLLAMLMVITPAISALAKPVIPAPKYERMVLIHYAKPPWAGPPNNGDEKPKENTAYVLIGPKWFVLPVSYVIDPDGAPEGSLEQIALAFEEWDKATSTELFNDIYTIDPTVDPSDDEPDFVNTVSWRRIAPRRTIAVTIIWFLDNDADGEPSDGDETIDCDIVMNAFHRWGIDQDGEGKEFTTKGFDVRNIATHEVGHVVGLDDLYDDVYSELTMYGYSKKGETEKISLEEGDAKGCIELYG